MQGAFDFDEKYEINIEGNIMKCVKETYNLIHLLRDLFWKR